MSDTTIINCYCHRDYTLSGDIKIEFYDDRVQIFSPGGLPDGLTLENIKEGMVAKRNNIIVNVLDKVDIIENYASGVRRIFEEYSDFEKQPDFYISNNGIKVTLFNRNYDTQKAKNDTQKAKNDTQKAKNDTQKAKNDTQKAKNDTQKFNNKKRIYEILLMIKENPNITINDMAINMNVSKTTILRDISKLKKINKIEYVGSSKKGYWKLILD